MLSFRYLHKDPVTLLADVPLLAPGLPVLRAVAPAVALDYALDRDPDGATFLRSFEDARSHICSILDLAPGLEEDLDHRYPPKTSPKNMMQPVTVIKAAR